MHISSCYVKILGETNFRTGEIPRSGSRAKDGEKERKNTPGTAGRPGGRDRKKIEMTKKNIFLHISSSYTKILGETNFQPREFPRSGSKAKDGKERKTERW